VTRLLCTGDLHLGAGTDYGREPGDRLKDQIATLNVVVDTAIAEEVDAVLFAGDAFEGPAVTPEQYAAFQDPLRELKLAYIPFIGITGNGKHDCAMRDIKAPEVVSDVAEIYTQPSIRVVGDTAVCMLPWTPVSRIVAQHDGGDRDDIHQYASELLVTVARSLRDGITMNAEIAPIRHRVLMLHYSIEGAALPNGLSIDEHAREVILPIDELEALGFDAIVAGHIHKPQRLDGTPFEGEPHLPIFYVGSPAPLNFGEGHYEHGVWLLELSA
jgi:DNA repair protein SbcD/Mre11